MLNDLFYDAVDAALAAAGAGEADVGEEDERLDTAQVQAVLARGIGIGPDVLGLAQLRLA